MKPKSEILVNITLFVLIHFISITITLVLGLFVLIVRYNKKVFNEMEIIWKEIKEM